MIYINNENINNEHFPDKTQMLLNVPIFDDETKVLTFHWKYEGDEELVTLQMLSMHYRSKLPEARQDLVMPYIPNARMDRVKSNSEVFTLKYFANIINSLKFDNVTVLDAHSDVSLALINNVRKLPVSSWIEYIISDYIKIPVLYFPDAGAMKRYKGVLNTSGYDICYGEKNRDWSTGKILGLTIKKEGDFSLKDRTVLMIDDIIAYGGTLAYSADELKKMGAGEIYAYATHTENSVLDKEKGTLLKRLEDGTVKRLFTTNSLITGSHSKITDFAII